MVTIPEILEVNWSTPTALRNIVTSVTTMAVKGMSEVNSPMATTPSANPAKIPVKIPFMFLRVLKASVVDNHDAMLLTKPPNAPIIRARMTAVVMSNTIPYTTQDT